jgi:hypothetical protein
MHLLLQVENASFPVCFALKTPSVRLKGCSNRGCYVTVHVTPPVASIALHVVDAGPRPLCWRWNFSAVQPRQHVSAEQVIPTAAAHDPQTALAPFGSQRAGPQTECHADLSRCVHGVRSDVESGMGLFLSWRFDVGVAGTGANVAGRVSSSSRHGMVSLTMRCSDQPTS